MSACPESPDLASIRLADLCTHIVDCHHVFMRQSMGQLGELLDAAVLKDGRKNPAIYELRQVYRRFQDEIVFHLLKEEQTFFPWIRLLETGQETAHPDTIPMLDLLEREHRSGDALLVRMRQMTGGFSAAAGASRELTQALRILLQVTDDMRQHVYEEDQVLFPRVRAMIAAA